MDYQKLHSLAYQTLLNLASEEGINASGKSDIFGCLFGRDSAITALKIIKTHQKKPQQTLMDITRKALLSIVKLQGKDFNSESGEEPGKFIHEFRKTSFEHLISLDTPWFIYPDGYLRNFDSVDSTPLTLIALYRFWEASGDKDFLNQVLPSVEKGLNWLTDLGDFDKDYLVEYRLPERKHGGLVVQSWSDSHETLRNPGGLLPVYPIAPVEVQGISWLAVKLWANYFKSIKRPLAKRLENFADKMKNSFNERFIFQDGDFFYAAQALDGRKIKITTITANPLICLWSSYREDSEVESIIDSTFIPEIIRRAFEPDMFVEDAGIRTMSALSPTFNSKQDSYHNGSFWPMLNGLVAEGLENFGFIEHSSRLKQAALKPIEHFGSPIELYIKDSGAYLEYLSPSGQKGCSEQAWSAAAILEMTI